MVRTTRSISRTGHAGVEQNPLRATGEGEQVPERERALTGDPKGDCRGLKPCLMEEQVDAVHENPGSGLTPTGQHLHGSGTSAIVRDRSE
jgi:hypothetical protein